MFVWNEELNMYTEADDDSENTSTNSSDDTDNKDDNSSTEDDNTKDNSTDDSEDSSTEDNDSSSDDDTNNSEDDNNGFDTSMDDTDNSTDDSSTEDSATDDSEEQPLEEDPQESYERYGYYQKFEKMLQCINSLENKIENIKQNNNEEVQLLKTFIIKLRNDINYIQTEKITNLGVENLSKLYLVLVSKLELMTDMTESYYKKSDSEE